MTRQNQTSLPDYVDEYSLASSLGDEGIRRLKSRYLNRDDDGNLAETAGERFYTVARTIAEVESQYGGSTDEIDELTKRFYCLMSSLAFLPGGRILANVASGVSSLFNCYVLPVPDDLAGIYEQIKNAAVIHKSGGGTGYNFSALRPRGMYVRKSQGIASGPVSFIEQFDKETEIINSGSRRGANMGVLNVNHPDILDFIHAKSSEGKLANFNISIGITDKFMQAARQKAFYTLEYPVGCPLTADILQTVQANIENNIGGAAVGSSPRPPSLRISDHKLIDTRESQVIGRINQKGEAELDAALILNKVCTAAWDSGEPGMIFLDTVEKDNPLPSKGRLEATNPCGEQPLHPYDACNLGSINLANHVAHDRYCSRVDWEKLTATVDLAVQLLDNCNDLNKGPIPEIEETVLDHRRIGLGVMGWADMLGYLRIPYDSEEALELADKLMAHITKAARKRSQYLARHKGIAPALEKVKQQKSTEENSLLRNLQVTTIAPAGTISMVAGCNSGIEPYFAMVYKKHLRGGEETDMIAAPLRKSLEEKGLDFQALSSKIRDNKGSIRGIADIPQDIQDTFPAAHEIAPEWHIKMQAAFQKHTDNAVSKTINLPSSADTEDVGTAFFLAWDLACKGITVYRDGCRRIQVLENSKTDRPPKIIHKDEMRPLGGKNADVQFRCRECGSTEYHMESDCPDPVCNHCGWSRGECG